MIVSDSNIDALIALFLSDEADEAQIRRLEEWVLADEAHRDYFYRKKNRYEAEHPAFPPESIDMQAAWKKIATRTVERASVFSRLLGYWQKVAAVAVFPLIFSLVYFQRQEIAETYQEEVVQEIVVPHGTRSKVNLPDGSEVWLNAGSLLEYPQQFRKGERKVRLAGEAYFKVKSDPKNPFVVTTASSEVVATGTEFNVEAYPQDEICAVTLAEGRVKVTSGDWQGELEPDYRWELDRNSKEINVVKTEAYRWCAWREGKLVFRGETLEQVCRKLGLLFNVDIVVRDQELAGQPYRATFENESLSEILRLLQLTAPIRCVEYKRELQDDGSYSRQRIEIVKLKRGEPVLR